MIDIFIVTSYLLALLLIGIYYSKINSSKFKSFAKFSDKANTSKLIIIATIFASSIGGGTTFGISEKTFASNIAYSYGLFFAIIIDILIAIYIIPRIIKHYEAESVGDIMSVYYGAAGRYIAGLAAMMVSVGLVAAQISVSGRIFEYILQIDYIYGVVISYSVVIVYTTIGGFRSVLFTNQLQFFAIIIAIPVLAIFGINKIGGIDNFISLVPGKKFSFYDNDDLLTATIAATLGFMVMNLFPHFIQRVLINKNAKETSKAIYVKSVIYAIFLIFITINGLIAYILFPEQKSSLALPILIDNIIPTGIQGFVIVGFLAAVMSTADSDLNVTSVTLVKDFLSPIFKIKNQQKMLRIARIANIIIGSFAIIIALKFTLVADLVIFISGFWAPIIIVPLVFALFDVIISKKMMILSCFTGAITFIIWEQFFASELSLKGVFVGTIANLIVFLMSNLCKKYKNY